MYRLQLLRVHYLHALYSKRCHTLLFSWIRWPAKFQLQLQLRAHIFMSSVSPNFHVSLHFCPREFLCNFLFRFFSGTTYYGNSNSLAVCTRSASTSCVFVSSFLLFLRGLTFRRTVCDCRVKCGCEVEIMLIHIMKFVHHYCLLDVYLFNSH
jgi:hypothetical protein